MKVTNAKTAPTSPNPHQVKAARVYESEHAAAVHLTLEPGQSLKRHITPVDVFFYVLEGAGVVEIGEEQETVGPDSLIESPARVPHCCPACMVGGIMPCMIAFKSRGKL